MIFPKVDKEWNTTNCCHPVMMKKIKQNSCKQNLTTHWKDNKHNRMEHYSPHSGICSPWGPGDPLRGHVRTGEFSWWYLDAVLSPPVLTFAQVVKPTKTRWINLLVPWFHPTKMRWINLLVAWLNPTKRSRINFLVPWLNPGGGRRTSVPIVFMPVSGSQHTKLLSASLNDSLGQ